MGTKWALCVGFLLFLCSSSTGEKNVFDRSVAAFSADVYQQVANTNSGNVLLCPMSVQILLTMMMSGARGPTQQEMSKVLALPAEDSLVRSYFSSLVGQLNATNSNRIQLLIANKLLARKSFRVSPDFRDLSWEFDSDVESVDFSQNVETAKKINEWVSKRTKNKISELISPRDITLNTQLLLINAIYFEAKWAREFDPKLTVDEPFYLLNGQVQPTPMMHQHSKMRYGRFEEFGCEVLEVPYHGYEYSLVIILPIRKDGLKDVEAHLAQFLGTVRSELTTAEVNLTMPKFELRDTLNYNELLQRLGMQLAFSEAADFSKIGAESESLYISKVLSKTYMSVSEEGTIAAAASSVGAVTLSIPAPVPKITFTADHPFLFFIATRTSNAPLFLGRFAVPLGSSELVSPFERSKDALTNRYSDRPHQPNQSYSPIRKPAVLIRY